MKRLKNILFSISIFCLVINMSGCGKENNKINSDSELVAVKEKMIDDLNNFSYHADITIKTKYMDVSTIMDCKEDRKNQTGYCTTSNIGVKQEIYNDYKNGIEYSMIYSPYSNDSSNGVWKKSKKEKSTTNSWLNLSDYIFNLTEEEKDGGIYYTGTIDSKKLSQAISEVKSDVNASKSISEDIDITVFVNASGYIEKISFDMEIMGMEEVVEITYSDFNSTESITIPANIK